MAVVDFQHERDVRAESSFQTYVAALTRAQASGSIHDMAAAVRAFDTFMRLAGLTEAERREILG